MMASGAWAAIIIGGALVAGGLLAFRADQRRVRVADPYFDAVREANIAEAVATGIPCRPIGEHRIGLSDFFCAACYRGPCCGVTRVRA
jgi:hypothetical protein